MSEPTGRQRPPSAAFAAALTAALAERELSQLALAEKLGVNSSTVSRWLGGGVEPEPAHVLAAEHATEVEPSTFSRAFGYVPTELLDALLPGRHDLLGALHATRQRRGRGGLDAHGRDIARVVIRSQVRRLDGATVSLADALVDVLHRRHRRQDWLAQEIGVGGATISRWVRGAAPNPQQLFAAEHALGTTPGLLSWRVGYVPVELVDEQLARMHPLVAAVELSSQIDEIGREIIMVVLDDLLGPQAGSSPAPS